MDTWCSPQTGNTSYLAQVDFSDTETRAKIEAKGNKGKGTTCHKGLDVPFAFLFVSIAWKEISKGEDPS